MGGGVDAGGKLTIGARSDASGSAGLGILVHILYADAPVGEGVVHVIYLADARTGVGSDDDEVISCAEFPGRIAICFG